MVAQRIRNAWVAGSSPASGFIKDLVFARFFLFEKSDRKGIYDKMIGIIFAFLFLVCVFKFVGLLLAVCGKVMGAVFSVLGFIVSLAVGVLVFGLSVAFSIVLLGVAAVWLLVRIIL